ncbi:hypothetical protein [Polaribacter sp. M15]
MPEIKINEDYLLLLIDKNGQIEIDKIEIVKNFDEENVQLSELCGAEENDNIDQIISFIRNSLQPKLPNKTFKYCKELDKAYQSIHINIELGIESILNERDLIFINQKIAIQEGKEFNLASKFRELKNWIQKKMELWFKVFDIEITYVKAKKISNVLAYSHRISGWSRPEYKITDNLTQEVKTNFGYGKSSYFYSILTYKDIRITPLSEWVEYRFAGFSEIIRYTRSFKSKIPVLNDNGKVWYYKHKIINEYWSNALTFAKDAANLSLIDEHKFIEKYIIEECEKMVEGLKKFYTDSEFEFLDENEITELKASIKKYRVNYSGFELINFRTEKIIGALDFIDKIKEYNSITETKKYTNIIISFCDKLIENVYLALNNQEKELLEAQKELDDFMITNNDIIEKNNFLNDERARLKKDFNKVYGISFNEFQVSYNEFLKKSTQLNHSVNLKSDNINRLNYHIEKYHNYKSKYA